MPRRRPPAAVPDHDVRRIAVAESLRGGLWVIPLAIAAAAAALAIVLTEVVGDGTDVPLGFRGDASSAQDLLTTIASSTLTMTTLVVSITIVALQLASQQFSPRVMRAFFRDTGTKVALGIFLGTTVYALLVLRQVVPERVDRPEELPALAVSVAFVAMLASLVTFLYFVHHVAHSIRVVHIIEAVAAETRAAIRAQWCEGEPLAPGEWPDRAPDQRIASEQPPGSVVGVDEDDLVAVAERLQVRIRLVPAVGDYLPSRAPLAEVWFDRPDLPAVPARAVVDHIGLGRERTMRQDVAFGFRQLVDIAEKALSPAVNDPTTAVQAVDRIHDLLRRLAARPDPTAVVRGADGSARVLLTVPTWDDQVALALDEVRLYGGDSLQVHRRVHALLDDLEAATADRPERRPALARQRDLLVRAAGRRFADPEDRAAAGAADGSGPISPR